MTTINLGDKAKDSFTGFTGICVGRFLYINGCVRIQLQPEKLDRDGKIPEAQVLDEPQLALIKAAVKPKPTKAPGGPRATPKYFATPAR